MSLIITIIVLIILASITILSLTNTKLFSKAQESTNKYKVAQQDEINTLNEYNSYISNNSRETITIDKKYYENLFSVPDNKLKDMPNTWELNTEYCWGNGTNKIYGMRFNGTVSETLYVKLNDKINVNNSKIVNWCETFPQSSNSYWGATGNGGDNGKPFSNIRLTTDGLYFEMRTNQSLNGNDFFDIWVLYTKN